MATLRGKTQRGELPGDAEQSFGVALVAQAVEGGGFDSVRTKLLVETTLEGYSFVSRRTCITSAGRQIGSRAERQSDRRIQ
jgi:hypothetical protein